MYLIGKIVNTHGIKGEVRIKSSFSSKEVFNVGKILYVCNTPLEIKSYRVHKGFDMVSFKGIDDINEVLKYKGEDVYIDKDDVGFVIEDLVGFDVYGNDYIGKVDYLLQNSKYVILVVGKTLIPYIDEFVKDVDKENKKIYINEIEGLINEN